MLLHPGPRQGVLRSPRYLRGMPPGMARLSLRNASVLAHTFVNNSRPEGHEGRKENAMKLTTPDKKMLLEWGHPESDFQQIEKAFQKSKTKYMLGSMPISREEAISLLGQKQYLSGIARSAFHYTAVRKTPDGQNVYFDSFRLFR